MSGSETVPGAVWKGLHLYLWVFGPFQFVDLVANYMIDLHKRGRSPKWALEERQLTQRGHWRCVYPGPWAPKQIL